MLILRFLYRVRPQCGDTSAMYKSRSLCSAYQVLRPIKAASVSGRLEWPPTTFCWVSSLLPCQSARRKPCRQPQPKVQCPAFPIAKKVHEGFSCDHLLSVKLVVICWILPPKERIPIDNHTVHLQHVFDDKLLPQHTPLIYKKLDFQRLSVQIWNPVVIHRLNLMC